MNNTQIISHKQYQSLQREISKILTEAKNQIQNLANNILAQSYWQIGKAISQQNLTENANYQTLLLQDLESDLQVDKKTLSQALRLYQNYPQGVKEDLSWSHYRRLVGVKDEKSRASLAKKAAQQKWSVRQLEISIKQLNDVDFSGQKGLEGQSHGEGEVELIGQNGVQNSTKELPKRPTNPSYLYLATIVNVVDGDTLILNIDLGFDVIKKQRVRLTQIDAPEMKAEAGQKSHHYLRDLCAGIEKVAVKTNKIDIYGRFLADIFYLEGDLKRGTTQVDIFTDGVYLNAKIVGDGFAEVF